MIIVGSKAAQYWGLNRREPKDTDIWISSKEDFPYKEGEDLHIIPEHILDMIPVWYGFPSSDALYTIKCSHFQWDIKWEKTKLDILHFKSCGCELLPDLYKALVEHWKEVHGDKSFLSLNKNKEEFFTDSVNYKYDHDYLHRLVNPIPIYTKILKKNEEVGLDKRKFNQLEFKDKVKLFQEEITVITFERWLVHNPSMDWRLAYNYSLKKTITNLTKNWASDFIITNLAHFKPDYRLIKPLLKLNEEQYKMSQEAQSKIKELYEEYVDFYNSNNPDDNDCESIELFIFYLAEDYKWGYMEKWAKTKGWRSLHQEGGGEGGAEYCEAVFHLDGYNFFCSYCYYSYNGHEYDSIFDTVKFVQPKEKTITVWE
jgi:hypothetical protein